jgi:hypothetical protein
MATCCCSCRRSGANLPVLLLWCCSCLLIADSTRLSREPCYPQMQAVHESILVMRRQVAEDVEKSKEAVKFDLVHGTSPHFNELRTFIRLQVCIPSVYVPNPACCNLGVEPFIMIVWHPHTLHNGALLADAERQLADTPHASEA